MRDPLETMFWEKLLRSMGVLGEEKVFGPLRGGLGKATEQIHRYQRPGRGHRPLMQKDRF